MGAMYEFHASIHRRPSTAQEGESVDVAGQPLRTLHIAPRDLATPFSVTFDDAAEALGRLKRMFVEPDGAFVWVSSAQESRKWQVDGVLVERENRLLLMDLKGTCPQERFDELLRALGWPKTPVVIQLVRAALFLGEDDFRRVAAQRGCG